MARTSVSTAERIYRAQRISTTVGRIYLGIRANRFIERRLKPRDMAQRWHRFNRSSARSVYTAAIELRGLVLKGCQFMGTRSDLLPREYVETLSKLQDRVPPRPFHVVRETVERELSCRLDDVFERFSTRPIAAASLAQVHDARLHNGERVAVKVQYPEIAALVRGDLANLRALFRAVDFLEGEFDLMPLVEELRTYVPRELNFVNEGRNAETVARQFKDRDDVGVPRIHWELTTRRVLVMDFVEGIKITDLAALRAADLDPARVAEVLARAYCEQILNHGFFHADPHPGNLLVQRTASGGPRIVFVDFGLSKDLPPRFREGAIEFASALLKGDADAMGEALFDLGFETRDQKAESLREIASLVLELAQRYREGVVRKERDFVERFGREIPERVRANPVVRIPTHLVLLGRVLALLSGVNRSLDTRIDLAPIILPYVMGARRG